MVNVCKIAPFVAGHTALAPCRALERTGGRAEDSTDGRKDGRTVDGILLRPVIQLSRPAGRSSGGAARLEIGRGAIYNPIQDSILGSQIQS